MKAMERVDEWMQGGTRWNVVFLYPEGDETAVSFVKMLRDSKELYAFCGSWTFSEEIRSTESNLKFEGQQIKAFQSVADIVVVLHIQIPMSISRERWMQSFHYLFRIVNQSGLLN